MRIRTILAAAAAPAALAAVVLGTAGQASAATTQHLTGSVVLSGPAQFEQFNNIGGPGNGSVSYTNFTYASKGSGVWTLGLDGPVKLSFGLGGGSYDHTMTVTGINVTGLNSYTFTGTGTYDSDPSYTWTATGSVVGNQVTAMHIVYTGSNLGYSVDLTATINADGSLTGSATDSNTQTLSLTGSADDATEVLSYTAVPDKVSFGQQGPGTAEFHFGIPAGNSLPAGTSVTVDVTDGGNPGPGHDLYAHNGHSYDVIGGNLTVH
jgi:hypothetical protein